MLPFRRRCVWSPECYAEGPEEVLLRQFALILVLSCGWSPLLPAQAADQILAQHIAALGGTRALKARAAAEYQGEARDEASGERGALTLSIRGPHLIYFELATGTGGWSEADNGKSSWRRDATQGLRTLSGADSRQLRATAYFLVSRFVDYRKDKWSTAYLGSAMLEGRRADIVEMANDASELAGVRCKFYFDATTHLLLRQELAAMAPALSCSAITAP